MGIAALGFTRPSERGHFSFLGKGTVVGLAGLRSLKCTKANNSSGFGQLATTYKWQSESHPPPQPPPLNSQGIDQELVTNLLLK